MRVVVDEAGRDDPAFGIDRPLGGRAIVFADPDNPAVLDRDIGLKRRLPGTVDHAPVLNEQIECHRFSSRFGAPPPPRWIVPRDLFWFCRSARRNPTYRLGHPGGCDNMFCRAAARTFPHGR